MSQYIVVFALKNPKKRNRETMMEQLNNSINTSSMMETYILLK